MKPKPSEPKELSKEQISLKEINECLDQVPISCGGRASLENDQVGGEWLVALTDDGKVIQTPLPILETSSKALYDSGTPSSFGRGDQTVYDESVRLAREYISKKFSLAFDPLHYSTGIMRSIESFSKKSRIYSVRGKMAIYGKGGFFQCHRDTPRSEDHIGTVVVCLPSAFTGGEFVLINNRNDGDKVKGDGEGKKGENMDEGKGEEEVPKKKDQIFDWASTASEGSNKLPWVFFYSDTQHSINPVKTGYRITLQYDIYQGYPNDDPTWQEHEIRYGPPSPISKNQVMDVDSFNELKTILERTLFDPSFFPNGGKLTWAFDHSYPHRTIPYTAARGDYDQPYYGGEKYHDEEFKSHLPSRLKGTDYILYNALQDLGFEVSLLSVWDETDWKHYRDKSEDEWWQDRQLFIDRRFVLPKALGVDYNLDFDSSTKAVMIGKSYGESDQKEVIWCKKPKTFTQGAGFGTNGNDVSLEYLYVCGVFQINLPPSDERVLNVRNKLE